MQEPRERALREEHDLAELSEGQSEQRGELVIDGLDPLGEHGPRVLVGAACLEQRASGLLGGTRAAYLRPLLLRRAGDPEPAPAERELERDLRPFGRSGVVRAQPGGRVPQPGNVTEQREADRVEDRRLTGPGLTLHEEQAGLPEVVEVDLLEAGERLERRHAQVVEAHGSARLQRWRSRTRVRPASSAARRSASSSSVTSVPRTSRTNWTSTPSSLSPRSRSAYDPSAASCAP